MIGSMDTWRVIEYRYDDMLPRDIDPVAVASEVERDGAQYTCLSFVPRDRLLPVPGASLEQVNWAVHEAILEYLTVVELSRRGAG